jgi:uncharacterized membrane protein YccC
MTAIRAFCLLAFAAGALTVAVLLPARWPLTPTETLVVGWPVPLAVGLLGVYGKRGRR